MMSVAEIEKIQADRARVLAVGGMIKLPEYILKKIQPTYPPADVTKWCNRNGEWCRIRMNLKKKPTHEKLQALKDWWHRHCNTPAGQPPYFVKVQIGNYLAALRRGGQLDENNTLRSYI